MRNFKMIISLASLSLFSMSAYAKSVEFCPEISDIVEIQNGVFKSPGLGGEWLAIQSDTSSDTPKEKKSIASFEMALVIGGEGGKKFQYCSYYLSSKKVIDMKFIPNIEAKQFANLIGDKWKAEEGTMGINYFVCEKTAPSNCKFTISRN